MRTTHSDLNQPRNRAADAAEDTTAATLAAEDFIVDLKHWREVRGLSQKRLAAEMAYDASYVSKIENAQQQPTHEFARRADEVLHAGAPRSPSATTATSGSSAGRRTTHRFTPVTASSGASRTPTQPARR